MQCEQYDECGREAYMDGLCLYHLKKERGLTEATITPSKKSARKGAKKEDSDA